VIATVPLKYRGQCRRVYPGFLQLAGFMSMNLGNHLMSHWEMFKHLTIGDQESAQATKDFYEEYRSVCDMTAEFYLQTIDVVFQKHALMPWLSVRDGVDGFLSDDTETAAARLVELVRDPGLAVEMGRAGPELTRRSSTVGAGSPTSSTISWPTARRVRPTRWRSSPTTRARRA